MLCAQLHHSCRRRVLHLSSVLLLVRSFLNFIPIENFFLLLLRCPHFPFCSSTGFWISHSPPEMCSRIVSPLLFIALVLCISSPGTLQDRYISARVALSRGRNVHGASGGEALPGSGSSSDSLEGSGRSLDRTFWSGIIIPRRPRPNLSKTLHIHCTVDQ